MSASEGSSGLGAQALSLSTSSPGAPPAQNGPPPAIQAVQPDSGLDSGVRVESKGLYILLWSTGCPAKYYWALMIAQSVTTGIIFYRSTGLQQSNHHHHHHDSGHNNNNNNNNNGIINTNDDDGNSPDPDVWKFVAAPVNLLDSPGLLCALKVGVLEDAHSDEWIGAVKQCVHDFGVPATDDVTCRVWVLGALHELAESGFIGMVADRKRIAGTVEIEARRLARDAELLGVGMVTESQLFAF